MTSDRPARRVAITGVGVICPLGNSAESLWDGLTSARSGVAPLAMFAADSLPMSFAGEARDFTGHIGDFGELDKGVMKAVRKGLKIMCRETQMGVAASQRALADAGLTPGSTDPERVGIVFGSDYMLTEPGELAASFAKCTDEQRHFDFARWGDEGMGQMTPLWLLKYLPNMPACHVAIYNDFRGPNNSLTQRESSSNMAVGEAFRTILRGSADVMVGGATGTRVHPVRTLHAIQQEEVAAENGRAPAEVARPFDRDRSGMVLGEGSGAVVLEELSQAQARGAKIYGEILADGSSFVADKNLVAKRDVALANAMRQALRSAGIAPDDVDFIEAHGLSTRSCDSDEAKAIRDVFGGRADKLPVTASKSYFGNLGAGSGAVELVAGILALHHGQLYPVLNYQHADDACPISAVQESISAGDTFVSLSVTPQGQASCVVVRKVD